LVLKNLELIKKNTILFSNLEFVKKSWFPKTLDLPLVFSMDCPWRPQADKQKCVVSQPGFSASPIVRLEDFRFEEINLEKHGCGISKKKDKGVLGRPWTKRMF